MIYELDQYFTPKDIAERIIKESILTKPKICVDSTCGSGRLLEAAYNAFEDVTCVGIDKDKNVIRSLRRKQPDWILSVGDLLQPSSFNKTRVLSLYTKSDLLVLNPPFSHGNRKSVSIEFENKNFKGSIAMAYILKSFELFRPKHGSIIIVPESILYSDTDACARSLIAENNKIDVLAELDINTFKGTRARSTVIRVIPSDLKSNYAEHHRIKPKPLLRTTIIRGGLPVHDAVIINKGTPFIHTTNLKQVGCSSIKSYQRVEPIQRGLVSGWMILIPRVGIPDKSSIKVVYFKSKIQLSDCVISLRCNSEKEAIKIERRLSLHWTSFVDLYRGTGARYVTIRRLRNWLESRNIESISK